MSKPPELPVPVDAALQGQLNASSYDYPSCMALLDLFQPKNAETDPQLCADVLHNLKFVLKGTPPYTHTHQLRALESM
eukprot:gene6520-1163_t